MLQKTSDFNKERQALQSTIFSVHMALSALETSKLKSAIALLEKRKQIFEISLGNLKRLFEQDRSKETVDVEPIVERTSYTHIQQAEATLLGRLKSLVVRLKKRL